MEDAHLHHLLTEDVLRRRHQADLPEVPQCNAEPESSDYSIPTHPAAFTFPTLSPDGSVDDISVTPSRSRYSTPPAALSTLGAKTNSSMADPEQMSDSTSSLTDSQYDMVDDASELSDDHETASLQSTEHGMSEDGIITPEDAGSDDEHDQGQHEEDEEVIEDANTEEDEQPTEAYDDSPAPGTVTPENWEKVDEANEVINSYLSDDLETPRQSVLPLFGRSTRSSYPPSPDSKITTTLDILSVRPLRVLFISDRTVAEAEKGQLCAKITSALAGHEDGSTCRATVLPLTPNGISPSSATIYRDGAVEVEVQHCVGAESKPAKKFGAQQYALRLLDIDGEHSSVYNIGGSLKPDLEKPDFAIMYQTQLEGHPGWMYSAVTAMDELKVPVMRISDMRRTPYGFTADDIMSMDSKTLHAHIEDPSAPKKLTPQPKSKKRTPAPSKLKALREMWPATTMQCLTTMTILTLFILCQQLFMPTYSPVAEHALRREALSFSLAKLTNCSDATKTTYVDHLLPQPTATSTDSFGRKLYSMQTSVNYQSISPDHIIISLPKQSGYSSYRKLSSMRTYRATNNITHVQTKLMDGVYDIAIDSTEAYGMIVADGLMTNPAGAFSIKHDFGYRMLQRQTYEKTRSDISKTVTKDLTVARKTVQSLGERLQLELGAASAATKNITRELAIQMTRDLQIFAHAASSMAVVVGEASNKTVGWVKKDLILAKQDIQNFGKALQKSYDTTTQTVKALVPTKQTIRDPLILSRGRALVLRQKLLGGKKQANSTSSTKELSTRITDLVKFLQPSKKWQERFLPKRMTSSLSTVPGKGLTSPRSCCKKTSARDAKARAHVQRERAIKRADQEIKRVAEHQKALNKEAEKRLVKGERMLQKARDRAAKLAAKV